MKRQENRKKLTEIKMSNSIPRKISVRLSYKAVNQVDGKTLERGEGLTYLFPLPKCET